MNNKLYDLNSVMNMKGVEELTQGDSKIEELLLKNCNELTSKVRGFKRTRAILLEENFDHEALDSIIEIIKVDTVEKTVKDNLKLITLKYLFGRVLKDYIVLDWVELFSFTVSLIIKENGGNTQVAKDIIFKYISNNNTQRTHHIAKRCEEYIKEKDGEDSEWLKEIII